MIKDSGNRTEFETGAVRDMHTGPETMRNIIRAETSRRKRGTNGEGKGK